MSMSSMGGNSGGEGGSAGASAALVLMASAIAIFAGGDAQRVLLTAVLTMMLYAFISFSPVTGIPMMVVFLCFIGMIKRYTIPLFGYTSLDPLLMVGPAVVGMFFVNKLLSRSLPQDTRLSKYMLIILGVMGLQCLNPLQGGIAVGLSGALFYIIPMLWYYCGRDFGTKQVNEAVLKTVLVVAVIGTAYGLNQQFFMGFSDVERQWIELTNNDRGQYLTREVMRVFSIFSSFAEYVRFLCIGVVIAFAMVLRRNRFAIFPCLFFLAALALSSSRGGLLTGIFGCVLVWAVQGKTIVSWAPRVAFALAIGVVALYYGLSSVKDSKGYVENDTAEVLLEHQAKGLLNPFDKKKSTGVSHAGQFFKGIEWGFTNPVGSGLGTTTIGGSKFGGAATAGVESDLGNMFISCGFVGGFMYLGLVGYICWRLTLSWHKRRDFASLATFAILLSSLGMWTGVAQYATTMLAWFLIGCIDRMDAADLAEEKAARRLAGGAASAKTIPTGQWRSA